MKKILFLSGLVCVLFFYNVTFTMSKNIQEKEIYDEESQIFGKFVNGQPIHGHGDYTPLNEMNNLQSIEQDDEPQSSVDCVCWWVAATALVGLNAVTAALGALGTKLLIHEVNVSKGGSHDESTEILIAAGVGVGLCALGACAASCTSAITVWRLEQYEKKEAEKKRQIEALFSKI